MASATAFLPRIYAWTSVSIRAQTQLRSVLQQCNVSRPFVVTDKNLEGMARSVLDSNDISGEIYADEVDEPSRPSRQMAAALSSSGADGVCSGGRQSLRRGEAGRRAFRKRRQMPRLQGARPDGYATNSTDGRRADDGRHGAEVGKVRRRHRLKNGREDALRRRARFVPARALLAAVHKSWPPRHRRDVCAQVARRTGRRRWGRRRRLVPRLWRGRGRRARAFDGFAAWALRGVGLHLKSAVDDEARKGRWPRRGVIRARCPSPCRACYANSWLALPSGALSLGARPGLHALLSLRLTRASSVGAASSAPRPGLDGDLPRPRKIGKTVLGVLATATRAASTSCLPVYDSVVALAWRDAASGSPANSARAVRVLTSQLDGVLR